MNLLEVSNICKTYGSGETAVHALKNLIAVYMTQSAFAEIMEKNNLATNPVCYVQFQNAREASKGISEIQKQYHPAENSISENTAVMGISGQSSNASVNGIYELAAVLFVLVLLAGVLMISGSMNSNVAQRTKIFGMLRCIGASRQQIIRFVRLEALNWCKTAVPIGLISGTVISWGVCALLRYGIGGEFAATPVFAVSPVGIICGAVVGIMTVLLAAGAPAKRASKVSPIAAVSGNMTSAAIRHHASKLHLGNVERTLGVHHAISSKRSWLLMTGSFSLSIILLLCLPVGLDFAHELLPSLQSWNPDITLSGYANALILEQDLFDRIGAISGVENIWATSYMNNIPAASSNEEIDHVNLISYSDSLLNSFKDSMVQGDIEAVYGKSNQVMTISNKDNPLKVGDVIEIAGKEVEITGSVSSGVWPGEYSVICSQETFEWLTGEQNYCLIGIQLKDNAADTAIQRINSMIGNDVIFRDARRQNQSDARTYLAAQVVLYSFLAIIAMITIFNIINSISMSVTARTKQYGAMRAVGMDWKQLTRMISAEAFTYAVSDLIVGCGIGIPINRFLHERLLTRYFGTPWSLPIVLIAVIILFDFISVLIAVRVPAKRICNMPITAAINEL